MELNKEEITHLLVETVTEYMLSHSYNMQDNPEFMELLNLICTKMGYGGYDGYMEYLEQCLLKIY